LRSIDSSSAHLEVTSCGEPLALNKMGWHQEALGAQDLQGAEKKWLCNLMAQSGWGFQPSQNWGKHTSPGGRYSARGEQGSDLERRSWGWGWQWGSSPWGDHAEMQVGPRDQSA